jgi:AcrR family transcriptional regulator
MSNNRDRLASAEADQVPDLGALARAPRPRRGARDRDATEASLLNAALTLLEQRGVLAGLNLREVAVEAGVNRGQIYQYFGSRRALLRAALSGMSWKRNHIFSEEGRQLPFVQRRKQVFQAALQSPWAFRVLALLVLDGDNEVRLFPNLDRTINDLRRDKEHGHLPPDADGVVTHVMTAVTYMGYAIFRETIARELSVTAEELDRRAIAVFERMLVGLSTSDSGDCSS